MGKFKNIIILFFVLAISFLALRSLWGPQFFTSHDGQSHMARLFELNRVLKEGQFPVRWAGQFSGARGYPVFNFAYPLPYWTAEVFYLLGFNLAESIKIVFFLAYLASGIGMFLFIKEVFKNKLAAFTVSIIWLWAPYRFVKIFVTASLGEACAFGILPFIFLFGFLLAKKANKKNFLALTAVLTAFIVTHLITMIIFFPLLAMFLLWALKYAPKPKKSVKLFILSAVFSLALSAFYLIPAIWDIRYTHFQEILTKNYPQQFVSFKKLIYSSWGYNAPGYVDGLSQQVGLAQWMAVFIALAVIAYIFLQKRKNNQQLLLGLIFLFNFVLAIFLMLKISLPVWDLFSPLQKVDTPWRFLSLAVFSSAFLTGFVIWIIGNLSKKNYWCPVSGIWLLLVFLAFYGNRNHLRINASIDWDEQYFANYYWVGSGWNEYIPRWARKKPYQLPPKEKVEIVRGKCEVKNLKTKSYLISFNLQCSEPSEVLVNNYYFPGWSLRVGNEDKTSQIIGNLEKSRGMVLFEVPKGNHQGELKFGETGLRLIADLFSLASISLLIFICFSGKKKLFS